MKHLNGILAGILIGIGGIAYLQIGGIVGAALFSIGLIIILNFDLSLFTGKAGKLISSGIKPVELIWIFICNLAGVMTVSALINLTPMGSILSHAVVELTVAKIANPPMANFLYGFFCGILMYAAVFMYAKKEHWIYSMLPVVVFIACGFNHCIADAFYFSLAKTKIVDVWLPLTCSTAGNLLGCNLIPSFKMPFEN